ncbi:hypothetical protein L7F22_002106 [Adiantum nelumboides]|nr:hypothetical protein [Adiantum nelumboides]
MWQGGNASQRLTTFTQGLVGRPSLSSVAGWPSFPSLSFVTSSSSSSSFTPSPDEDSHSTPFVEDLLIPSSWTSAGTAAEEAEWLRINLHQWLDDEYCPEPANNEISRRCSRVYYYCLLEKQRDMGDILMQMVRDLETFSFKESFHGAFSSANAAIDLITKKIRSIEGRN